MNYTEDEMKLANFFVVREGEGVLDVLREIDFFKEGIIDSLDVVDLAVHIEREFDKKIDLTNSSTFDTMKRFESLYALASS